MKRSSIETKKDTDGAIDKRKDCSSDSMNNNINVYSIPVAAKHQNCSVFVRLTSRVKGESTNRGHTRNREKYRENVEVTRKERRQKKRKSKQKVLNNQ